MPNINKSLNLIIFPTEECNFRCKYCYEHFEIGRMYENVINGIKSLIKERSKDIDRLNLDWFGGEPLLAFDIVDDIMKYARKCADVSGLTLTSGMTTNASLFTKTKQEELIRLGVTKFQITLDGDTELHNSLRVTRNNTSTFNIIYNNLIDFHRSSLDGKIIIRLHVNSYFFILYSISL